MRMPNQGRYRSYYRVELPALKAHQNSGYQKKTHSITGQGLKFSPKQFRLPKLVGYYVGFDQSNSLVYW